MNRIALVMSILTMVAVTVSAQETKQVCTLKVSGMACGACANTVEKAAKKIGCVKDAKVSQPDGSASITYDPAKTTPEAIAKAISAKTPFKAETTKTDKK